MTMCNSYSFQERLMLPTLKHEYLTIMSNVEISGVFVNTGTCSPSSRSVVCFLMPYRDHEWALTVLKSDKV